MATSYPGGLDSFTNPTATDSLNSATVPHATQHANANDAIEAIQAELGTDPAGASATVKARFDVIEAAGWVTSTRILDGTIVNGDINAAAAIDLSKLATGALPTGITVASANIVNDSIVDADINSAAAIALSKLATGALPTGITVASANLVNGTIVDEDINATAAIAQSKIANLTTDLAAKVDETTVTTYLEEYLDILESGEASIPRYNIAVAAGPATSGRVYLTYRRAARTETIDTLAISTGTTAAGATPTLCKIGVYEEDPSTKDLTLVASTANDTTLFAATSTRYERATTANWTKTAGKRYAYAVIVVTSAAMPTFQGVADSNSAGAQTAMLQSPRLAGARIGQTDLPATIAAADIGVSSSRIFIQAMT